MRFKTFHAFLVAAPSCLCLLVVKCPELPEQCDTRMLSMLWLPSRHHLLASASCALHEQDADSLIRLNVYLLNTAFLDAFYWLH